ncbi:sugar transferase [Flagellimonas olearia]|uniref:Sugar transferase n=1 Tax=Flagellimonas olearia TaxID=552546 RepID=A0A6I1E1K8_9FLAO|nr:sugar transferase [Allomuricauda olearia]KAB7530502.1 sugar transferase [Allomuricauda olearia]
MKRILDIFLSSVGIVLTSPILLLSSVLIKLSSKGPIIYKQKRVGRYNNDFNIFKFRTMYLNSDKKGLITVGDRDPRVTSVGYYLRKLKIDELPQLFNVLLGQMSMVGPRPEVRKYVDLYSPEDLKVLNVKPGITDYASILFRNENELLKDAPDPHKKYIEEIMPKKLSLNKEYISQQSFVTDLKIICLTMKSILNLK